MRNLSSLIGSTHHKDEASSRGVWAAGLFVALLLAGSAAAAFWMGNSITGPSSAPTMEFAEDGFQ